MSPVPPNPARVSSGPSCGIQGTDAADRGETLDVTTGATVLASLSDGVGDLDGAEELMAYFAVTMLVAAEAIFPLLPGETTVVTAATFASQGDLNIWAVFVAAWLGAMIGDFLLYGIGRLGSERIVNRASRAVGQDRIDSAGYFFQRYGQPFLVAGRFVPGLRVLTALTAGTLDMPLRRYAPAEILGAGLWAAYASWLGYAVGSRLEGQVWISLAISLLMTALLSAVVAVFYRRAERTRKAEAAGTSRTHLLVSRHRSLVGGLT